jgi:hypothetical protein
MAEPPPPSPNPPQAGTVAHAAARRAFAVLLPERNAGRVAYGTILVGALMAAESGNHEGYPEAVASALTAAVLFWVVHGYTLALEQRFERQERITPRVLGRGLLHEAAILRGAAIPLIALLLAWATGANLETAVTLALWSSVAAIFLFELGAGISSGATGRELAFDATVGAALGIAILVLKALLH